jgi:hypothetical protein
MRGGQWQHEQQARLIVMGASLTAKLTRLPAKDFRSAVLSVQKSLDRDPDASEHQDPETQRALILEWADSIGLKVERHERPVI